jgi:uncharacterized protein YhbP (UPF0306 family)
LINNCIARTTIERFKFFRWEIPFKQIPTAHTKQNQKIYRRPKHTHVEYLKTKLGVGEIKITDNILGLFRRILREIGVHIGNSIIIPIAINEIIELFV